MAKNHIFSVLINIQRGRRGRRGKGLRITVFPKPDQVR